MRIELGEYGLKSLDANCLTTFKRVEREKKGTSEKYIEDVSLGYYGTLEAGLKGLVKHSLKNNEARTLKELEVHISAVKDELIGLKELLSK
jgi:hypothetical protein